MARKGTPREEQHEWGPADEGNVQCARCKTIVTAVKARHGAGPCPGVVPNGDPPSVPKADQGDAPGAITEQSPGAKAAIAAAAEAQEKYGDDYLERFQQEFHLCTTCHLDYPDCEAEPEFGLSVDNVLQCYIYRPESDEPEASPATYTPTLTDPAEYCNSCGDHLAIMPVNSKLDMIACRNLRCPMYRERLRMVGKPVKRGRR